MAARHRAPRAPSSRVRRSRRIRALLSGGLVLGVGVSVTMAAWTDTEVASGAFGTSVFGTQSSVDAGSQWADNTTTAAVLNFGLGGFSPTVSKYATLQIRTVPNSVSGKAAIGAVQLDGATDLRDALRVRVVWFTDNRACALTAFTGAQFVIGTAAGGVALATTSTVQADLGAAAGPTLHGPATTLCFEVSLPAGPPTLQGKSVTATWTVTTTSDG